MSVLVLTIVVFGFNNCCFWFLLGFDLVLTRLVLVLARFGFDLVLTTSFWFLLGFRNLVWF